MTRDEIEKLKALELVATLRPWRREGKEVWTNQVLPGKAGPSTVAVCRQEADADYLAAVANALPRLLEERERLLEALLRARMCMFFSECGHPDRLTCRDATDAAIAFAEAPASKEGT